eukprot:gene15969-15777_t
MVEERHYPWDPRGTPLPAGRALVMAMQFFVLMLVVNLAVLPMVFFGIGAIALVAANAYLLGREYFEMVAMRHMPVEEAKVMRKENILSLIPIVNLAVPLFATSYFTHIFKSVRASSA